MNDAARTRRAFLLDAGRTAAGGWLTMQLGALVALAACAHDAEPDAPLVHLSASEGRTMRAVAARIIPSEDGRPGAEEANAIAFVDRAIGLPAFADSTPVLRAGLVDLDARARALGTRSGFADLDVERQIDVLRAIDHTEFFATARTLVVIGTLAEPRHGGNRGGAGWQLVGMEHRANFQAPFGWYDAHAV